MAVADTTTTSCGSGDNTLTTYCPVVTAGTDDESAVMAGFQAGAVIAFGAGLVVLIGGAYHRYVGGGVR